MQSVLAFILFIGTSTLTLASPHPCVNPITGFSCSGPWNQKIPKNVKLAANSAAIVENIRQDKVNYYNGFAVNTDEYSSPIFKVDKHTPKQKWTYVNCLNLTNYDELYNEIKESLASVPTPPDLFVSKGTDASVAIYQPSTDTYWDFWRAEQDPTTKKWSTCWGGMIKNYSRNPGIFRNPIGATATGLPFGAFLIRIEELRRGYINHAINLQTVRVRSNCNSWPATRNDGWVEGDDIPCEGQRFRLDPSFNVSTLTFPAARVIARAMQEYGLILTDKAGAVVTQAEDPRIEMGKNGGIDPYFKLFDPMDYVVPDGPEKYVVLYDLPIERLQALPLDYGKPKP
ncbi:hypothetical protein HK098_008353 [Nowakowskiella sp. JEL0407]|nr:hypothetical protein HK098_008353 [Nowakowskiella sp. JEL0407]